jgi:conjugative transfer signal peptidase TraF
MPEAGSLPLFRWGEELRRRRDQARTTRARLLAAASASMLSTLLLATVVTPPAPRLVWTASASSPIGLYVVLPARPISIGDHVVASPPAWAARLAAERRYLPRGVPLVKPVAAVEGDRVCAIGETIFINGAPAASRLARDTRNRAMPVWNGCETLGRDRIFLLAPPLDSFDGRYFGVTEMKAVVGRALRL